MPDREKLISANALVEHLDRSIAESKGLIGSTCVAIKCYVEQMPAVDMPKWIPVTERLPEDSGEVVLCTRSRIVGVGFYDKSTRNWVQHYAGGGICVDVTHWMPLPEPPKEV